MWDVNMDGVLVDFDLGTTQLVGGASPKENRRTAKKYAGRLDQVPAI